MEESRKLRLKQRDDRERLKFSKFIQRTATVGHEPGKSHTTHATPDHEISIQGIRFRVAKGGSKLVKISGKRARAGRKLDAGFAHILQLDTGDNTKATPKTATVGGVRFYRSKNGNLYRSGIVKASRYDSPRTSSSNFQWERICTRWHLYSLTPSRRQGHAKKLDELCKTFTTTGIFSHILLTLWTIIHLREVGRKDCY